MKDAIGREIHIGDVCAHVSRQGSNLKSEVLIVRSFLNEKEVCGEKIVSEWSCEKRKDIYRRRSSKNILACNVIITGMTEDEVERLYAIEAM